MIRPTSPPTALLAAGVLAALAALAALITTPPARAASSPWSENSQAQVRLITPFAAAPASGELRLGLQFTVVPGWHVYWKNSGDAGFPPVVDFSPTPEVHDAELLWPAPERYELPGGLVAFGYEHEVVYPIRARLEATGRGAITLAADLDYLVCEVECVPYSVRLTAEQPLVADPLAARPDPATAPLVAAWWERLPVPAERAVGIATRGGLEVAGGEPALVVEVDGESARRAARPEIFLAAHEQFTTGAPRLTRTPTGLRFRVPLQYRAVPAAGAPAPVPADFAWTVTGLDPAGGGPPAIEAVRTAAALEPLPSMPSPPAADTARSRELVPLLLAALAVAATALALYGWGLLGGRREGRAREALGFAALAAALGTLYALSARISSEGLAFVELALLAAALVAWLRRRAGGWRFRRAALSSALIALAVVAVWLAARSTLPSNH